ncbi:MAG TPA: carboxylating nicotinate-nucleotide diphosphorylase [Methylococcaceae bacterium]|jgi:nicotinate-nucleotide pyrophosphorylase (carboxylating)|nr:carboxylating nicotinate-nucleotide diphosphorylase [Methylococcaceae bacterium]HIA44785.1 carboxylating nicotinate-nucleotide diphosphorylase [Methylococcaceae bacterium]HIN69332.1 carboxylating nicotinate-nucleotide diphosphorylase [Methylococcales bacterium]
MVSIEEQVDVFLREDIGSGDLTALIIPEKSQADATVITRQKMIVCGQAWFNAVFRSLDEHVEIVWLVEEGEWVDAGIQLCTLSGGARGLLTGERTALNVLQTLSAVATESWQYSRAVVGTNCQILDTRKTLPGLRLAQKYAVKCGGCLNHRVGLYDGILIKENHIIAAGSISAAVSRARLISSVVVEVEVENQSELREAVAAHPDRIMLDNFSLEEMREAVAWVAGRIPLEASGDVTLETLYAVARTGVDFISVGALTKNISAIDLSMRISVVDI